MALPDLSLRRPVATAMVYVGVAVLGGVSFVRLPIDLLPDVSFPTLSVWTEYTDAGPAEVERFVTERVEQALYSIPGARGISSRSREGQSLVQLRFAWGTDMEFATLHTRERLDNLTESLPEASERPVILRTDPTSEPILTLAVSGAELRELRDLTDAVFKRRLEQLDGVSLAAITGGPERELLVIVDPDRLGVHDVTLDAISSALDQANYNAPGGSIRRGRFEYSLRTLGQFQSVDELLDVVISTVESGARGIVRLGDVASVRDTIADRETIARYGGEPAIGLQVFKEAGTNTVRVADTVQETLAQLRVEFPQIDLEVATSQASFIRNAISNVISALLLGGALAFVILFLFLRDPKYPLAIGLAIPISITAAFTLCYWFDVSLNIMSLGGLALGVGLLVDNSIVVLENIFRHRAEGSLGAADSASRGAREVGGAITASTFTTIAVFGPVLYVEGVAGALFGDLSLAVAFSLLASLLVALTLLPVLAARVARKRDGTVESSATSAAASGGGDREGQPRPSGIRRVVAAMVRIPAILLVGIRNFIVYVWRSVRLTMADLFGVVGRVIGRVMRPGLDAFERAFERFAARYERTLEWSLSHRTVVMGIAALGLAAAVMVANVLPRELMPRVDERQFRVNLDLPQGTPIRVTDELAGEIENTILELEGVSGVFTNVGRSRASELATRDLTGLNNAVIDVQLTETGRPTLEAVAELRARIRDSGIDPASVSIETGRATSLGRALALGETDLAIVVEGPELEDIVPVAEEVERTLAGLPMLADVRLDFLRTQPELIIEVHRDVAARHGLTVTAVADAIESFLRGSLTRNSYAEFADKINIRVSFPEEERRNLDRVLDLRLEGTPIRELVTAREGFGPVEIRREDQTRTVQVVADVASGGLQAAVSAIEGAISEISRPALSTIRVGGDSDEMQQSFQSLTFAFGLALVLVFLIMAAQFESVVQPLVVLAAVPLAAIGALLALWVAGDGINTMSGIGLIILIGVVVNDAIVKVDFINQRRRSGLNKRDAILEAGRLRLRPIIMTTVTTVAGLTPLALGLGAGADLRSPLAVAVIGGLTSATFLTLIVVPVVYSLLVEPRVPVGWAAGASAGSGGAATSPEGSPQGRVRPDNSSSQP